MPYRKVVDGLLCEVVESHFFSQKLFSGNAKRKLHFKWGKLVIDKSVTEIGHDWTCPDTRNPENFAMSASFPTLSGL